MLEVSSLSVFALDVTPGPTPKGPYSGTHLFFSKSDVVQASHMRSSPRKHPKGRVARSLGQVPDKKSGSGGERKDQEITDVFG